MPEYDTMSLCMKDIASNLVPRLQHFIDAHLSKFWLFLLTGYVTFVLSTHSLWTARSPADVVYGILKALVIAIILCPLLIKGVKKLPLIRLTDKQYPRWETSLFFFLPFLFFLFQLAVYYPGSFHPDNLWQYGQALFQPYNDWHPVLSTLILFKIPLILCPGWIAAFALWQLLLLSGAIAYGCCSVRRYTNRWTAYILLAVFLLDPQTGHMAINPCKDSLFAVLCLMLTAYAFHIYCTNGQWLHRKRNTGAVILLIAITTLVRHNAILFTAPFTLAVMTYVPWRKAFVVFATICLLFVGVKGVLFPLMHVVRPLQRQLEILGAPMSIIGAVAAHQPEKLDAETKDFIYRVAAPQKWELLFYTGFNNVKWHPKADVDLIEQYGVKKVLLMAAHCIKRAPLTSLQGVLSLTYPVYSMEHYIGRYPSPYVTKNLYEVRSAPLIDIPWYTDSYQWLLALWFPHFYLGFWHLLLLIACTTCTTLASCRKLLFSLPVFCYNFGTALLMSGAEDCWRFFFYAFLAVPILLLFFFIKPASAFKPDQTETA